MRPPGWQSTLTTASQQLTPSRAGTREREAEKLRGRVDAAEQALREVRTEHRAQVSQLRSENTELRRKLGETQAVARAARGGPGGPGAHSAEALTTADHRPRAVRGGRPSAACAERGRWRPSSEGQEPGTVRAGRGLHPGTAAPGHPAGLRHGSAARAGAGPGDGRPLRRGGGGCCRAGGGRDQCRGCAGAWEPGPPGSPAGHASGPAGRRRLQRQQDRLAQPPRWRRSGPGCSWGLAPLVARTGVETTVVFDAPRRPADPWSLPPGSAGRLQPRGRDRRRRDP